MRHRHWLYAANVVPAADAIDLSAMTLSTAPTSKMYTFNNVPGAIGEVGLTQLLSSSMGAIRELIQSLSGPQDIAGTATTGSMTIEMFSGQAPVRTVGPGSRGKFLQKPVAPAWKFRRRM